jgi:hypothetical protein
MINESIKKQSKQIFQNIEILFNAIPASEFDSSKGGFQTWKHFYHLVHSMDKNFINPENFMEPPFHQKNLDIIYLDTPVKLTKNEIKTYYLQVKEKIGHYLDALTIDSLNEIIQYKNLSLTKLELILAQFRHIFYHIGYLHCCIKIEKGETPEYIGLYKATLEK